MKKILVIDGHPYKDSFVSALCGHYAEGAVAAGFEVRRVNIRDLKFNPNLMSGYSSIQQLEPDLLEAQELVKWCEHLVFAYPIWWGNLPAITKGFFDRSWVPGFAFRYHKEDPFWDRLLAGRSARLIATSDAPLIYNFFAYFNAPYVVVRKMIFKFCGFKPIWSTHIGGVKNLSEKKRESWLNAIRVLGSRGI